jgi:hypothetical protein
LIYDLTCFGAASPCRQFFEFGQDTLLPLVVENRESRENRLQFRCGIEQRPSMHHFLVHLHRKFALRNGVAGSLPGFQIPQRRGPRSLGHSLAARAFYREITSLLKKGLQVIPQKQFWVNPDCGLKTRGWEEVCESLGNLISATRQLRSEPGASKKASAK